MQRTSNNRPVVFAETNWIYDCVFQRDVNAQYMFDLNEENQLAMTIPRFAFAESKGQSEVTIQRRIDSLKRALATLRELRRSRNRAEEANQLMLLVQSLIDQLEQEIDTTKTFKKWVIWESSCSLKPEHALEDSENYWNYNSEDWSTPETHVNET